jgi:dienelactone hydrolase
VRRETYRWAVLLIAALLLVAGCGGSGKKKTAKPKVDRLAHFAYDASKPLTLRTKGTERRGTVQIRDISFAGPRGERVLGYLVVPPGNGPHPAVIYAHGAGGERTELLDQAVEMSKRGAVTLALEMPYSQRRAIRARNGIQGVREQVDHDVLAVQEVRRSVDLLRSLPIVGDQRIAYVGWSAGARTGAIVAGVDHRVSSLDLLAGGAVPLGVYELVTPKAVVAQVLPLLTKIDALYYVRHAAPSALFLQNGRFDQVVPTKALRQLAHDASNPKDIRWYQTGHVPGKRAWGDSRNWLSGRLGLTKKT